MIFRICRKGWSQQEPAEVFHSMHKIDMHVTYVEIKRQYSCVAQMHFPKAKALPSLLLHGTHTHSSLPFASAWGITSPMERILPQQHPTTPSFVQQKRKKPPLFHQVFCLLQQYLILLERSSRGCSEVISEYNNCNSLMK